MRRGENPSEVLKRIKSAVEDLNSTRLPAGVRIRPIYDRTDLVNNTLNTVSHTLLEGLTIVFLVLFFFLGSMRAAVLTAIVIPLSLLFAFLCMYLYGIHASLLSLGALDFGIIVDGTLVMVEYIVRQLSTGKIGRASAFDVIRGAAIEIERPILFSLAILISRLSAPVHAGAGGAAVVHSHGIYGVLRAAWFAAVHHHGGSRAGHLSLQGRGEGLAESGAGLDDRPLWPGHQARRRSPLAALRWPPCAVTAGVLAVGANLGSEFLPQLDEGVIWIRSNLPAGTSLAKTAEIASDMRRLIRQSPEVLHVGSQSGRVEEGTDPFGPNRIELLVTLRPYSEWPRGKVKKDLVAELSRRLSEHIPGANFQLHATHHRHGDRGRHRFFGRSGRDCQRPGLENPPAIRASGLGLLRGIPGAADTSIEQEADQAQLRIEVDRQALARYAINIEDVQELIDMAIGGKPLSVKFEGDRQFDIAARYIPEARVDASAIGDILVHAPGGERVPLSQLADIHVVDGASMIARRENRRQITVRTNIRGRDQGSFVAEAQRVMRRNIRLQKGYEIEWGGQFENLDRARRRLYFIMPVTIAIIFALLFWAFGSATYAGLALLNVPFSAAGGVLALYLRGINLSVSAAVGFISLFGVAVMSGVLYISQMNRQRREKGLPLKEAVVEGARIQFRQILILIMVAMLGHGAGRAGHRHRFGHTASAGHGCAGRVVLHAGADAFCDARPCITSWNGAARQLRGPRKICQHEKGCEPAPSWFLPPLCGYPRRIPRRPQPEKWNLHFQATSIGQYHGGFNSPYADALSLQGHPEAEASLTSTLYFGWQLPRNTQVYFDPELAGGRGFSGTNGIADFPNGEMPRVETAAPKLYLARLYVTQDFGFGDAREFFSSDENQLAGSRPMTRYSVTIGRFTVTDFFDNNKYTHDPRTQFMGWAIMYNGAWDYPADTHGYTWGWVHEFHTRRWSLRYASAAMPTRRQRPALRPPRAARPRRCFRRRGAREARRP